MAQKIATSSRNPYPYPLCENDNTFQGGVFERVSINEYRLELIRQKSKLIQSEKPHIMSWLLALHPRPLVSCYYHRWSTANY